MSRLPAEWEKHAATWITWPCRLSVWSDYAAACQAYANVINAIAEVEPVYLIINEEHRTIAQKLCTGGDNLLIISHLRADDSWSRDTSPIFLDDKATCWQFNAWGEKFFPYDHDAALSYGIAHYLQKTIDKDFIEIDMVLEGGSINTNGQGTLLTTKECLLNPNRNPHLTQSQIEENLKEVLCVDQVIWLEHGQDGDVDTDGHVDNTACFANKESIIIQSCDDMNDPNFNYFQQNKAILKHTPFTLHEIPQPLMRRDADGARMPLSYINFYFTNETIILPTFESPKTDDMAEQLFKDIFPQHTIVPIAAMPILQGGGGIHCITMQQPEV